MWSGIEVTMDPISSRTKQENGPGQLENLRRAGYMSPVDATFQGGGFSCGNCDWFVSRDSRCLHPLIKANVEHNGCSNLFTYKGVHT